MQRTVNLKFHFQHKRPYHLEDTVAFLFVKRGSLLLLNKKQPTFKENLHVLEKDKVS